MPRKPLLLTCRVCGTVYPARARRYKLTCSPECALYNSISATLVEAHRQGISLDIIWYIKKAVCHALATL